jgi:hypothetical protein
MVRAFAGELDKEKRGGHMSLEEERRRRRNHCLAKPIGYMFSFLTVEAEITRALVVYKTAEIYRILGQNTKKAVQKC